MLSPVSSINNMMHSGKKKEICGSVYEAARESTKVASGVCGKAMEKMEKRLHLQSHEVITFKKFSGQHCYKAKS